MKKKKSVIIFIFLVTLLFLTVGYSSFATDYDIKGIAEITGIWNVKITGVTIEAVDETCLSDEYCDPGTPEFTDTSVTFNAKLAKPGNTITYRITIENAGTIEAKLDKIVYDLDNDTGSSAIYYTATSPQEILKKGETTSFIVQVEYDKDVTEIPLIKTKSITGTVKYVQN